MTSLVRRELSETARTFVVKVGTNVLSDEKLALDPGRIARLAEQVHALRMAGKQVVLVSSGSIGAGMTLLGLKERPRDLPHVQAAAATGQAHLIGIYDQAFRQHGYHAAQLLLTADDFRNRSRYLNVRNTLRTLFEYGCVPIINENDTVSVNEIRSPFANAQFRESEPLVGGRCKALLPGTKFSDNDQLAAMVTNLLDAPLLIILSVIDGLYDGDPRNPQSGDFHRGKMGGSPVRLRRVIPEFTWHGRNAVEVDVGQAGRLGRGKRHYCNGHDNRVLEKILAGEEVGTAFLATGRFIPAWKRWIGYTVNPLGSFVVDDGARRAMRSRVHPCCRSAFARCRGNSKWARSFPSRTCTASNSRVA
ncbi:MAG: glutamate 5-kinase [Planctomycetaceae bacterium]